MTKEERVAAAERAVLDAMGAIEEIELVEFVEMRDYYTCPVMEHAAAAELLLRLIKAES